MVFLTILYAENIRIARGISGFTGIYSSVPDRNIGCGETIPQIGNRYTEVGPADLIAAVGELLRVMDDWSREHGEPFVLLDMAGHMDEERAALLRADVMNEVQTRNGCVRTFGLRGRFTCKMSADLLN